MLFFYMLKFGFIRQINKFMRIAQEMIQFLISPVLIKEIFPLFAADMEHIVGCHIEFRTHYISPNRGRFREQFQ
ncbi:hypothetical protein D3C86_2111140 [compost metagenome]